MFYIHVCLFVGFQGFLPPVLIFVQSKDRAKELFHELIYDGYNVDVIHADKSQIQVGGKGKRFLKTKNCNY